MPTPQFTHFCFTLYEPHTVAFDESTMRYLCWGDEICPTTGRPHKQGYVQLKKKVSAHYMHTKYFPHNWFKGCRGSDIDNTKYCSKENNNWTEFGERIAMRGRTDLHDIVKMLQDGAVLKDLMVDPSCCEIVARHMQYFNTIANNIATGIGVARKKSELQEAVLRPWQLTIRDLVTVDPDPRHVYWVYDTNGNQGKSFLTDYLIAFHDAVVFTHGKVCDISHTYNYEPVVIFDLARSQEEKLDGVYMAIECFKNGRIFSPKYHSHTKVFRVPHVIIFANFAPDKTKLSEDRWKVHNVTRA